MYYFRRLDRNCVIAMFLMALVALAGCGKTGDSHAKAAKDIVTQLQSISDALATVNDKPGADAATLKIVAAADHIDKIAERIKKLPPSTKDENDAIHIEVQPQMTTIKSSMQSNIKRLQSNGDLIKTLQPPMARLQAALSGVEVAINGGPPRGTVAPPAPTTATP